MEGAAQEDADPAESFELMLEGALAGHRGRRADDGFKGRKTVNEVLDRATIHTMYAMIKSGTIARVNGVVSAGKESVVFWATDPGGRDVALKVYLVSTSNFKRRTEYIEGDPRFGRIRGGTRAMVHAWTQKEFKNLKGAHARGIRVPEPIAADKNVLAMEFVGSGGVPARTLNEVRAGRTEYEEAVGIIGSLYSEASLVHADMSGYNMFAADGGVVAFDLGSAVDTRHPRALEFLKRDISNVANLFVRHGLEVENPADVLARIVR